LPYLTNHYLRLQWPFTLFTFIEPFTKFIR
jgi:hypothetical protein